MKKGLQAASVVIALLLMAQASWACSASLMMNSFNDNDHVTYHDDIWTHIQQVGDPGTVFTGDATNIDDDFGTYAKNVMIGTYIFEANQAAGDGPYWIDDPANPGQQIMNPTRDINYWLNRLDELGNYRAAGSQHSAYFNGNRYSTHEHSWMHGLASENGWSDYSPPIDDGGTTPPPPPPPAPTWDDHAG
jgi:hypothetical protein